MAKANNASRWAIPAVMLGSVCLSFGPFLVRHAGVPPMVSAFWRMALAIVPLSVIAWLVVRKMPHWQPPPWRAVGLAGVFFAADLIVWHLGIVQTTLANASLLSNLSAPLLVLSGIILYRRFPDKITTCAILLATAGVVLLSFGKVQLSRATVIGDALCFCAAIFYTAYLLVIARERARQPALVLLACVTPFAALAILPLVLTADGMAILPKTSDSWIWLWMLALGSQVAGQGLIVFGFGRVSPVIAGLALLIQPLMSGVMGWRFYDERLGLWQLLGGVAIIASLLLVRTAQSDAKADAVVKA